MQHSKKCCTILAILCPSFRAARFYYYAFLNFLDENEPWFIKDHSHYTNSITMEDDITYVFIDRHYIEVYERMGAEVMEAFEFFYGIDEYYGDEFGTFLEDMGFGY